MKTPTDNIRQTTAGGAGQRWNRHVEADTCGDSDTLFDSPVSSLPFNYEVLASVPGALDAFIAYQQSVEK